MKSTSKASQWAQNKQGTCDLGVSSSKYRTGCTSTGRTVVIYMKFKLNRPLGFLLANLTTLICTLIRTNFLWNHVTSIYVLLVNTVQCPAIMQGMLRGIYSNWEIHLIERAGECLVASDGCTTKKSLQIFWYQVIRNIWKKVFQSYSIHCFNPTSNCLKQRRIASY